MRKLLVISDFVAHTGFARVSESILENFNKNLFDIHVLGINYHGDYTPLQHKYKLINPNITGGDFYGYGRVNNVIETYNIEIVFIINDPWVCSEYLGIIRSKYPDIPVVLYTPVDAKNLNKRYLNNINTATHIVAYTKFAKSELIKAGVDVSISVIPHGIDTSVFYPVEDAKQRLRLEDYFIVNITDRNSLRKRIDLGFKIFSEFAKGKPNVKLYYHGSLLDVGYDIINLAEYYNIENKMILSSKNITPAVGLPQDKLNLLYSASDVGLSTTMGEGWGLTAMERMACKVPMILPKSSAYAEWAKDAAYFVDCVSDGYTNDFFHINALNTVGSVINVRGAVKALNNLYYNNKLRSDIADRGFKRVNEDRFKWNKIAAEFEAILAENLPLEV